MKRHALIEHKESVEFNIQLCLQKNGTCSGFIMNFFSQLIFHWIYIHYRALEHVPLQIALYVKGVNVVPKQHSCQ